MAPYYRAFFRTFAKICEGTIARGNKYTSWLVISCSLTRTFAVQ